MTTEIRVDTEELKIEARNLRAAPGLIRESLEAFLFDRGEYGKTYYQRRYRIGGTSATRTAYRTGKLHDAVGANVSTTGDLTTLEFGFVKPDTDDQTLGYARIQEGIDFSGAEVTEFVIVPKTAKVLSWIGPDGERVFAQRVVLKPRPGLEPTFTKMVENVEVELPKLTEGAILQ